MKNKLFDKVRYSCSIVLLVLLVFYNVPMSNVKAETTSSISFGSIDYDALTLQVYNNNNSIVYYSTDKTNWYELESAYDNTTSSYSMDISWVSDASEVTLYFKGNTVVTIKSISLPMKNSLFNVTYDKAEGEFSFDDTEESDYFEWRKSTDYNWTKVNFDETTTSYTEFITTMNTFRTMGAKIIIRIPQTVGTGNSSVGVRQSREVTVNITKRANAPTITVNLTKLTLNTTEAMEYYDSSQKIWVDCDKSMLLEDIAPTVLYVNGGKTVTFMIRTTETSSTPYSKTASVTIAGQTAAPVIGDDSADITYYYVNSKLTLQFHKATTSVPYEYTVVGSDDTFDGATATWKTVSNSKLMTISSTSAPDNCKIYVRKKGLKQVLPSATVNFTVIYP